MSVRRKFENHYSEENLLSIYNEHLALSHATGIDNLDQKAFWPILNDQIGVISRKALHASYKFTKYKLKLISKGRGKPPREISIPTIRDRITLRALCNFLVEHYDKLISFKLPQEIVNQTKSTILSKKYGGYIKLDVSNFYPTVKHQELLKRLRRKIRNPEIIDLIHRALQTPTVSKSTIFDKPSPIGIPQGLSISNILAAIYLTNIDKYFKERSDIYYSRYVDDILILCDLSQTEEVVKTIIKKFKRLGLSIHDPIKSPEKSKIGKIHERFDYLGYQFENGLVTARSSSVEKLRESITAIFTGYKHSTIKSEEFLLWRLNLRITGCIFQNKCKGWLFFFSEINDESLLHNLDRYVTHMIDRFSVNINPKKFVRAYFQITHRKYESTYVPNFDNYTIDQMKEVLVKFFNKNISKLNDEEIEYAFRSRIQKQVNELLTDVQGFGY